MEGIDYNIILQDYLDELSHLRSEFIKTFTKVKENSKDIQKVRTRLDLREKSLSKFYETNGFTNGVNPQEAQVMGKVDKEFKTALNKCEDSKARLKNLKTMLEIRINKMNSEALIWDPTAKSLHENGEDHTNLDANGYKVTTVPEKRKISVVSASQVSISSRQKTGTHARQKKPPKGSHQRDKTVIKISSENGNITREEEFEESENDDRLYCFCSRESFGDMVGCDGENCPHEWFHYECVGLTEPPKGSWHCPSCSAALNIV